MPGQWYRKGAMSCTAHSEVSVAGKESNKLGDGRKVLLYEKKERCSGD